MVSFNLRWCECSVADDYSWGGSTIFNLANPSLFGYPEYMFNVTADAWLLDDVSVHPAEWVSLIAVDSLSARLRFARLDRPAAQIDLLSSILNKLGSTTRVADRRLQFYKGRQLFISVHNEASGVTAICAHNPN
jgi:hypothetical protein